MNRFSDRNRALSFLGGKVGFVITANVCGGFLFYINSMVNNGLLTNMDDYVTLGC